MLESIRPSWGIHLVSETAFTVIASAEDIAENNFSTFQLDGADIVICRFRDEFFALENRCSHARATFDDGRMRGYSLMCPMHGATFDIRDGTATGAPARKSIRTFPVRVVDGMIEVDLGLSD